VCQLEEIRPPVHSLQLPVSLLLLTLHTHTHTLTHTHTHTHQSQSPTCALWTPTAVLGIAESFTMNNKVMVGIFEPVGTEARKEEVTFYM